jgi:hypothetical protein
MALMSAMAVVALPTSKVMPATAGSRFLYEMLILLSSSGS